MRYNKNKLPVWSTVKNSYKLAWNNYSYYLRISGSWLIILLPLVATYCWFTLPTLNKIFCGNASSKTLDKNYSVSLADFVAFIYTFSPVTCLLVAVTASIAVAWHRLILLNEKKTKLIYLRLDSVVRNYFGVAIALIAISYIHYFFIFLIASGVKVAMIGMVITYVAAIIIVIRVSTLLPAKALSLGDISVKDVWQKTRSNFWRLLLGNTLCYLPLAALTWIATPNSMNAKFCSSDLMQVAFLVVHSALYILVAGPIMLSFLSLQFKYFFGDENDRKKKK